MAASSQNSTNLMPWTSEIEADFIEEVRKKEYLWNIKSSLYTKKALKRLGYDEISSLLQSRWPQHSALFETGLLIKKFSKLKYSYRRELSKLTILKSGSEGTGFISKWLHFSSLSFLNDTVEAEESISNIDSAPFSLTNIADEVIPSGNLLDNDEDGDGDAPIEIPDHCIQEEEEISLPATPGPSTRLDVVSTNSRKRKREENLEISVMKEAQKALKDLNNCNSEDAYGQFIASMLKEIKDPRKRHLARIEIQKLLINYIYEE